MKRDAPAILIVEDDPPILSGLLDVLVFHGYRPTGLADGHAGLEAAAQGGFDLLILDVMLPGADGFAICRSARERWPALGILMLTARGAEADVVRGFEAGADDYVCKPFSVRELMLRVQALLRRLGRSEVPARLKLGAVTFDGPSLTARCGSRQVSVTRRELDLLARLSRQPERIVSRRELLREVWHYADADIETRTVEIHIQKLRRKLSQLTGGTGLIQTVRGEGWRLEVP
jgi:two-component system response regulator RegX3